MKQTFKFFSSNAKINIVLVKLSQTQALLPKHLLKNNETKKFMSERGETVDPYFQQ